MIEYIEQEDGSLKLIGDTGCLFCEFRDKPLTPHYLTHGFKSIPSDMFTKYKRVNCRPWIIILIRRLRKARTA